MEGTVLDAQGDPRRRGKGGSSVELHRDWTVVELGEWVAEFLTANALMCGCGRGTSWARPELL
jgi:hypothetical protein